MSTCGNVASRPARRLVNATEPIQGADGSPVGKLTDTHDVHRMAGSPHHAGFRGVLRRLHQLVLCATRAGCSPLPAAQLQLHVDRPYSLLPHRRPGLVAAVLEANHIQLQDVCLAAQDGADGR